MLFVIAVAVAAAGSILILTHLVGGRRLFGRDPSGPVKQGTYESGVPTITDARRQFSVRFYMVAMLFLLFDVEIVFLWPWAPVFYQSATGASSTVVVGNLVIGKEFLLAEMVVFLAILLVGYVYAWRKGVFRWD
ncbi:MAG: NADH-quinone oxidoreductase subunit A [bacterium]|nr:NADH-quinone oxidoreductase subunit A [bacterium]